MSKTKELPIILIAEDDPDDRLLASEAFAIAGVRNPLRFVRDGDELLAYLNGQAGFADRGAHPMPCLVIIDLNMPRKDGRAALAELRGNPSLVALPVAVLTTSRSPDDEEACRALGACAFLTKPVAFDDLVDALRGLPHTDRSPHPADAGS